MPTARIAARVTGVVQGVSFRWFTRQQADRLGLSGWVRNERDGSVALEAQGDEQFLAELVDRLHAGPPAAQVVSVRVDDLDPVPGESGFEIRH